MGLLLVPGLYNIVTHIGFVNIFQIVYLSIKRCWQCTRCLRPLFFHCLCSYKILQSSTTPRSSSPDCIVVTNIRSIMFSFPWSSQHYSVQCLLQFPFGSYVAMTPKGLPLYFTICSLFPMILNWLTTPELTGKQVQIRKGGVSFQTTANCIPQLDRWTQLYGLMHTATPKLTFLPKPLKSLQ